MKHTRITYIPDCPECGKELKGSFRYDQSKATTKKPFGVPIGWWFCEACGYKSEETEGKPYDSIKYEDYVE